MTEAQFTVDTAMVLAEVAHSRQKDKLKRPYVEHVLAVGDALADFDDDIRIAGYLHDIAEDTPMTRQGLLDMGVPPHAVELIERVSKNLQDDPDDYLACIRAVAEDHDATLVKISDNAHNSLPERVQALARKWPEKTPTTKYADAREILYRAVPESEVLLILNRANPDLIPTLEAIVAADNTDSAEAHDPAGHADR
ncbi:MAG: HD domain-containing protein [Actinomycetota bacterium]|uniref:HD domain-containing protein n=1 Tax=Micrococcaceae TaxID=1268 RepID=UPI0024B930FA|nr:HD domain-containing protein [Paenarthrobacter sp. PH39-S1]MDJ0355740.1 HD domain-containing protein [Paenarthrobacter sp. PH39-S1]MDQ6740212.1 HD domain-containing protein [Actinomycetota bacterium]